VVAPLASWRIRRTAVREAGDHKGRPYSWQTRRTLLTSHNNYNNAPGLFLYLFAIASALM
jgi:hypothetical protein